MRIVSVLENQINEKRISITPEIAKKYLSLGFEVVLPENYASHLGIKDTEYSENGVNIILDKKDLVLGKNQHDITKEIIKLLNEKLTTLNLQ